MKTKDYIFIGLAAVISIVLYFLAAVISSLFGTFGHSVSPGLFGLFAGVIFVYINYNYPKKGIFTLYTLVLMAVFAMMGGAYLPWLISSVSMALVADLILSFFGHERLLPQVFAWVLMQLGSAAGQWIPIWFFVDSFRKDWVGRGQTEAAMDEMIQKTLGIWGVASVLLVASLTAVGVLVGRNILKKYQKPRLTVL